VKTFNSLKLLNQITFEHNENELIKHGGGRKKNYIPDQLFVEVLDQFVLVQLPRCCI